MTTIGINGFGRMGRLGVRAAWANPAFTFKQVNEIAGNAATSAHLLKFDSIHGIWQPECSADEHAMYVDGKSIAYTSNPTIAATDWSGCDIVLECTGKFRKVEQLQAYFDQGVKKVIVAAPVDGALNIVMGVNDTWYKPDEHHLITAA